RPGSADADAADRGILRGAQDERRAGEVAAAERRVSRHQLQAVELHSHATVHDELVQAVLTAGRRPRHEHIAALSVLVHPVLISLVLAWPAPGWRGAATDVRRPQAPIPSEKEARTPAQQTINSQ